MAAGIVDGPCIFMHHARSLFTGRSASMLTDHHREARRSAKQVNSCLAADSSDAGQKSQGRAAEKHREDHRVGRARIDHAHCQGVIHRDLKPSNILIDEHDQPKVLDFGVARSENLEASQAHTSKGELVGTLAYMSPEQFAGPDTTVDRRTDIYSLGVILYRLLSGYQ